ncbi:MAG: polynucleotide adenylyltransferase, partial [Spirochaetales bacterium]|nr:polynucleotide adenylyltransferase [Spirochaetales bacterium]
FYGHDAESARIAEIALKRLKYPNVVVDEVAALIRYHMFDYADNWTDAAVRRFVSRVGFERVRPLALLRLADSSGMGHGSADPRSVLPLVERVEALQAKDQAFSIKDLAINGNDLSAIGWPRGPAMGRALAELLEAVLDDPELNTREKLLDIARRIQGKHGVTGV